MKEFLEPLNLFGYKINFTYKRSKSFNSLLGLFISFVVYIVTAFLLYYFSKDFFEKTNPKINYKQKQISPLSTSLANFFVSEKLYFEIDIGKNDQNDSADQNQITNNDEDYFQLENFMKEKNYSISTLIRSQAVIREEIVNEEIDTQEIVLVDTILDFYNFDEIQIINNRIIISQTIDKNDSFYICKVIKKHEDKCQYSEHFNSFENFNFIIEKNTQIRFRIVINHTLLNEENLKVDYLNFNYTTSILDKTVDVDEIDFFSDFEFKQSSKYKGKLEQSYTRHEVVFGLYNVSDDEGVILPNPKNIHGFVRDSISVISKRYEITNWFVYSLIRFQPVMVEYNRIYKKVQNILADIGGIFSSFIVIGNLLIETYNKKYFCYQTMNFLFEGNEQVKVSNQNKSISIKDLTNFKQDKYNEKNIDNYISSYNYADNSNQKNKEIFNVAKAQNETNNQNDDINKLEDIEKPAIRKDPISNQSRIPLDLSNMNLMNSGQRQPMNYLKINANETSLKNQSNVELSEINPNKEDEVRTKNNLTENKIAEFISKNLHGKSNPNYFFIKAEVKGEDKYVKFSIHEYFINFFCLKKFKNKQIIDKGETFAIGENMINRYMNVLNYFNFYEDFEKLKSLILNEHQNFTLKFLKRRSVNDLSEGNYVEKLLKTSEYYKANQGNYLNLDRKILDMLSFNIIELI